MTLPVHVISTPTSLASRVAEALGGDVAADITGGIAEPVEWLWHGVIARGDAAEAAGPSYSGKSTLSFLLACASVSQRPVTLCGRLVAQLPSDRIVVIVNVEQRKASIERKLTEAALSLGLDPDPVLRRIVVMGRELEGEFHAGTKSAVWGKLAEQRASIGLLVLDSRARLLKGDSDSESDQTDAAARIGYFTKDGNTVLVISHVRKSAGREGAAMTLEDLAGHHQRGGGADCALLVQARRSSKGEVVSSTVHVVKRRDDGGEEHPEPMTFSIDRSGETPRLGGAAEPCEAGANAPGERVFELLAEGGAKTVNAVATELGMRKPLVTQLLAELKRAGRVRMTKVVAAGQHRNAFEALNRAVLEIEGIIAPSKNTGRIQNSIVRASRTGQQTASKKLEN